MDDSAPSKQPRRVVLLVRAIEDSPDGGPVVRAYAEQEIGSVEPVAQLTQEQLDAMIAAGDMPALCMASEAVAAQWTSCLARPGVSMEIHLKQADAGEALQSAAAQADRLERMEYLTSYANLAVHRLMLSDQPRTETYRQAICAAVAHVKATGASVVRVLDVGAGTGVLSMFAAAAAAAENLPIQVCRMIPQL